jgi:hypothetical protein
MSSKHPRWNDVARLMRLLIKLGIKSVSSNNMSWYDYVERVHGN